MKEDEVQDKELEHIGVNELNSLLGSDEIVYVEVADMICQREPKQCAIGIGGILTIYYRKGED